MMDSFYDTLTLEHQASGAEDENWKKTPLQKAGFKVPGCGGNHSLSVNTLELSSSLSLPFKAQTFSHL